MIFINEECLIIFIYIYNENNQIKSKKFITFIKSMKLNKNKYKLAPRILLLFVILIVCCLAHDHTQTKISKLQFI